ncbi:MAG: hypothetical protein KGN32_11445 [Burkholderiales bacterium]|nr:hypothetical protein [Burkholderiales bacterium]
MNTKLLMGHEHHHELLQNQGLGNAAHKSIESSNQNGKVLKDPVCGWW